VKKERGLAIIEIVIILLVLTMLIILPLSCHSSIIKRQKIFAEVGVEMTYWDIFCMNPEITINQGEIRIKEDK